jgi:tetratricopeptide (TPR) repeat protein
VKEEEKNDMAATCIAEALRFVYQMDFEKAISSFDEAWNILKDTDDEDAIKLRATIFDGKALACMTSGRIEESTQLYKKSIEIRSVLQFDSQEDENASNIALARALMCVGRPEEAYAIADKALDVSCYQDDMKAAMHLYTLSQVYQFEYVNNYKKVKEVLLKARTLLLPRASDAVACVLDIQHSLALIEHEYEHDVDKALFELEKAWKLVEKIGIDNCLAQPAAEIGIYAANLCDESRQDEYYKWRYRYNEVFGRHIEKGDAGHVVIFDYIKSNTYTHISGAPFSDAVTVKRALLCLDFMESHSRDEMDIAYAQWFAGSVLAEKDKSREAARKSVRLVKKALRVLKAIDEDTARSMTAVGEECIADYHFSREEYDLAAEWYRAAQTTLTTCVPNIRFLHQQHFSKNLEECLKHM